MITPSLALWLAMRASPLLQRSPSINPFESLMLKLLSNFASVPPLTQKLDQLWNCMCRMRSDVNKVPMGNSLSKIWNNMQRHSIPSSVQLFQLFQLIHGAVQVRVNCNFYYYTTRTKFPVEDEG